MNKKHTGKASDKGLSDWKRFRSLTDHAVRSAVDEDPEVLPTDARFWKTAKVVLRNPSRLSRSGWMRIYSNGCGNKRATRRGSTPCCGHVWMRKNGDE